MSESVNTTSVNDIPLPDPIDALITVSISDDKLEASVNISPPQNGGAAPNVQSIRTALTSQGVIYGVDNKVLLGISSNPPYNQNIVIARGTRPINGIDGTFIYRFKTNKDNKPKEREDGTVDFHNLELVENVSKDQVLCDITLPTEGKDGTNVKGVRLPCINGKPVPSLMGNNTRINEDKTQITSAINGQVELINGKINVNETLFIKNNIDNSTGNINVAGNIIVSGSVQPGFIIKAAGNIQVNGSVNSATLVAGGNIVLQRGVIGGTLHADGDITSKFIENCSIFSKGNIKTDYIMNSNIKCGKNLHTVSSISKIVGGKYVVGENIVARIIGSSAGIRTHLEIGTDSSSIERQQELIRDIPAMETKANSLESLISLLKQFEAADRLTYEKKQTLEAALFSYENIKKTIAEGKAELEQISEAIKEKGYGKIICSDTIYPGTFIKIGSMTMKIREDLVGKSLYYTDEGIAIGMAK